MIRKKIILYSRINLMNHNLNHLDQQGFTVFPPIWWCIYILEHYTYTSCRIIGLSNSSFGTLDGYSFPGTSSTYHRDQRSSSDSFWYRPFKHACEMWAVIWELLSFFSVVINAYLVYTLIFIYAMVTAFLLLFIQICWFNGSRWSYIKEKWHGEC